MKDIRKKIEAITTPMLGERVLTPVWRFCVLKLAVGDPLELLGKLRRRLLRTQAELGALSHVRFLGFMESC